MIVLCKIVLYSYHLPIPIPHQKIGSSLQLMLCHSIGQGEVEIDKIQVLSLLGAQRMYVGL